MLAAVRIAAALTFAVAAWADDAAPGVGDERWSPLPNAAVAPPELTVAEKDLASPFTGAAAEARAALDAGDARRAAALVAPLKPKDAPTRFLRAAALLAAGRPAEAAPAFASLAGEYPVLADRCHHDAATAWTQAGELERAAAEDGLVSDGYVDAGDAALARARALFALDAAFARSALDAVLSGRVRGDLGAALELAGQIAQRQGDVNAAREAYRAAWLDHPLSPFAERARGRDRLLPKWTPPAPEALVRRAEALLEVYRNREAIVALETVPLPPLCPKATGCGAPRLDAKACSESDCPPGAIPAAVLRAVDKPADALACRARLSLGKAYRKDRQTRRALETLRPVWDRCGDADIRQRALYLGAQAATVLGGDDTKLGAALYRALADGFPGGALGDDALLGLANLAHRAGNPAAEWARLEELVQRFPSGDTRAEALFRLFLLARDSGKAHDGLRWLDQLEREYGDVGDGLEGERARYWRAVTLLATDGDAGRAAAAKDFADLATRRPMAYYGLLARGRLAGLDAALSKSVDAALAPKPLPPEALRAGPLSRDPHLAAGVELVRLGFKTDAARELNAVDRQPARDAGAAGQEALVLVGSLLARAGDVRNAHLLVRADLRGYLRRPSEPLPRAGALVAYPLAFRASVEKHARAAGLPPDLLQGLMREESALDPLALSPVGALGLTQLMPATARAVARVLRVRGFKVQDLVTPDLNIRLGATYLGQLVKQLKNPALAVAAYNCGPGCVSGWLRAAEAKGPAALELDAFVEQIPVDETRQYVKRVLRSYAAYRYLYGVSPERFDAFVAPLR